MHRVRTRAVFGNRRRDAQFWPLKKSVRVPQVYQTPCFKCLHGGERYSGHHGTRS